MMFSIQPLPGTSAFLQWKDGMKAVNKLPMGIPDEFRKKVWLSLAEQYIRKLKIDWSRTVRLVFNERSNPDDDKIGFQIVKDVHRTGCSSFNGDDNISDRSILKRVLLAYARWNKRIGYCQGFNVIAAFLLNVMNRKEDDALKVMIYLIDHVLPESYFDNSLSALSVDIAVFRDLLRLLFPTLSRHLERLQLAAQDVSTGACYEPPLTNVFTVQWFLTLFATCLPKSVVLRVWDAILLEGSEVVLRTALCLWGKLARRIMKVNSADEFYSLMGELSTEIMKGKVFDSDGIVKAIYSIASFPMPHLSELRETYTYNISPFSKFSSTTRQTTHRVAKAMLYSEEEELDEDELRTLTSVSGLLTQTTKKTGLDMSVLGPRPFGNQSDSKNSTNIQTTCMDRTNTDLSALKMQYNRLRQRQKQAHIIIATAASGNNTLTTRPKPPGQMNVLLPRMSSPLTINHLFVGKESRSSRNRVLTSNPCLIDQLMSNRQCTQQSQHGALTPAGQYAVKTDLPPTTIGDERCLIVKAEEIERSLSSTYSTIELAMSNNIDIFTDRGLPLSHCEPKASFGEISNSRLQAQEFDKINTNITNSTGNKCLNVHNMEINMNLNTLCNEALNDNTKSRHQTNENVDICEKKTNEIASLPPLPIGCNSNDDDSEGKITDDSLSNEQRPDAVSVDCDNQSVTLSIQVNRQSKQNLPTQYDHPTPQPKSVSAKHSTPNKSNIDEIIRPGILPKLMDTENAEQLQPPPPAVNLIHSSSLNSLSTLPTQTGIQSPTNDTCCKSAQTSSSQESVNCQTTFQPAHGSIGKVFTQSFHPFPVKQVNANRIKTGIKLGLYTHSTLQTFLGKKTNSAYS